MASFDNFFAPKTPLGANLSGLVTALYSGDPEGKRMEREAMMRQREEAAALKRAQTAQIQAKLDAEKAAQAQRAAAPLEIARGMFGGAPQGDAVMKYREAGGIAPPLTPNDDEGFAMPSAPMPRPQGYTPQAEEGLNRLMTAISASGMLPGKSTIENVYDATGKGQQQDIIRNALAGLVSTDQAKSLAPVMGALKGESMFSDNQGRVLDRATGGLNETGPQAVANVGKTKSEEVENQAQAARARREGVNVEVVADPSSPTGFKYVDRRNAVGMPAPLKGATSAKDALTPTTPNVTAGQRSNLEADDTLALISNARSLASDPRNFGLSGIARSTVQDAMEQGDALARTLGQQGTRAQQEIINLGSDVGIENFDPTLPQLDMMTNLLAFRMAKMNDPGGRVTDQDFRIAKSKITGGAILGNQKDFLARLDLFENTLRGNQGRTQTFLGGRGNSGQIKPAPSLIAPPGAAPPVIRYDAQGNRIN